MTCNYSSLFTIEIKVDPFLPSVAFSTANVGTVGMNGGILDTRRCVSRDSLVQPGGVSFVFDLQINLVYKLKKKSSIKF